MIDIPVSLVTESAYEDEEQFARGGTTPGEGIVGEEDAGSPGEGDSFPLRMAADAARDRLIAAAGGFLRGAGQHVNFDPEAPPPPQQQQQTINLLERPEIDKKVKVRSTVYVCACHQFHFCPCRNLLLVSPK